MTTTAVHEDYSTLTVTPDRVGTAVLREAVSQRRVWWQEESMGGTCMRYGDGEENDR